MKKSILKPIIGGALLGAFVYFTGPLIFIIFILKFIFTPFGMYRMRGGRFNGYQMGMPSLAFAEKVRGMDDEEFNSLKEKMRNRYDRNCSNQ